jgi:hypothetical protein
MLTCSSGYLRLWSSIRYHGLSARFPMGLHFSSSFLFLFFFMLNKLMFHFLSYFFVDLFHLQMKSTCKYANPGLLSI